MDPLPALAKLVDLPEAVLSRPGFVLGLAALGLVLLGVFWSALQDVGKEFVKPYITRRFIPLTVHILLLLVALFSGYAVAGAFVLISLITFEALAFRPRTTAPLAQALRRLELVAPVIAFALGAGADLIYSSHARAALKIYLVTSFEAQNPDATEEVLTTAWSQYCAVFREVFAGLSDIAVKPDAFDVSTFRRFNLLPSEDQAVEEIRKIGPDLVLRNLVNVDVTPEGHVRNLILIPELHVLRQRRFTLMGSLTRREAEYAYVRYIAMLVAWDLVRELRTGYMPQRHPAEQAFDLQAKRNLLNVYRRFLNVQPNVRSALLTQIDRAVALDAVADDVVDKLLREFVAPQATSQQAAKEAAVRGAILTYLKSAQ